MPVTEISGRESPFNGFSVNALLNVIIFSNIFGVIIVNETIPRNPPESEKGENTQKNDDKIKMFSFHKLFIISF
jgi:hypothetical protein